MGQTQSNFVLGDDYDHHGHKHVDRKTMKKIDLNRYTGTWWEAAKYPIKWEKECVSATANYTFDKIKQVLKVKNSCWSDPNAKKLIYSRTGEAWIPNMEDQGRMKLEFTDGLPSDGVSDYLIHWTDYDNYAIVGGSDGQYLWVLSRKQKIPSGDIDMLIEYVKTYQYDPQKLVWNNYVFEI